MAGPHRTGTRRGRCCVTLDLGMVDGKRKRKYFYGTSKRQAREKRDAFKLQHRGGIPTTGGTQTVQVFLQHWLEQVVKRTKRAKTYTSYEEITRLYVVPSLGSRRLDRLAPEHVNLMIAALQDRDLAPRTIQYACGVLSRALNWAVKQRMVAQNVVELSHVPKVRRTEITPLTHEEAQRLLDAVRGHRLEALYRVALQLGLRQGELLSLQWSHVDMQAGIISVARSKTEAGVRKIAIPPQLQQTLTAHRERQQEERHIRGTEWQEHGLVFPSEVGTPILKGNLHRQFKASLAAAGLPHRIRFHDLRHTCTTFLFAQGVHPRTVMGILGHSTMRTTMEIYGHVLDSTQREAVETLDDLFT